MTPGRSHETNVADIPSPSERAQVDPLFSAMIRYRNMVENAKIPEASGESSQLPPLDTGDDAADGIHKTQQDLKSEKPSKVKIKTGIKSPLSASGKVVQSPKAPFDMLQDYCQELQEALDAISSGLNTIVRDITSLRPAK